MLTQHELMATGEKGFTVIPSMAWVLTRNLIGDQYHERYAYKINRVAFDGGRRICWFVEAEDTSKPGRFIYLGQLDPLTGLVRMTEKSAFPETATRVKILRRVLACLWANKEASIEETGWQITVGVEQKEMVA